MKLSHLLQKSIDNDIAIEGITADSRSVRRQFLYVAVSGARTDGIQYIDDAIENGAVAIVAHHPRPSHVASSVVWIEDDEPRILLAQIASRFYGLQPETIVAVTGTNGKTSVVNFCHQIWSQLGASSACIGTLGVQGLPAQLPVSMTTPDPVVLHATLADMTTAGIAYLAMEASSHGLDQHRLDGVRVSAAGFTNLTRDHLDYHHTMDEYRDSKMRLFKDVLRDDGVAVANIDVMEGGIIQEICAARGIKFWSYGYKGENLKIISRTARSHGQVVHLNILGQEIEFLLPLVGEFQLYNVLCATGLVLARREKCLQEILDILPRLHGVVGRLQLVDQNPEKPAVYVDYAHTPDALEHVLRALRPHTMGKLICVFGCGGDRDRGKRAEMGKIANTLCDHVIVTDDNPRSEDPQSIRNMILSEAVNAQDIGDRYEAIRNAIRMARKGDVILIAGKGHEQGQIFDDHVAPFDDVEVAKTLMNMN